MTTDESRFANVSAAFSDLLAQYGLRRIHKITPVTVHTDGWRAFVANWASDRPKVAVWFDHSIEEKKRHFWFGFQAADHGKIDRVLKELQSLMTGYTKISADDLEGSDYSRFKPESASTLLAGGLAHETYGKEDEFEYFGKYDTGFDAEDDWKLAKDAAVFIGDIVRELDPLLAEQRDIEEIKKSDLKESERLTLILARRGQGKFRRELVGLWGGGCSVTECKANEALRASHIKPWYACTTTDERLDKNNGLLLTANLDALFDQGLITFFDNGLIQISNLLDVADWSALGLDKKMSLRNLPLCNDQQRYLAYHRENVFKTK